MCASLSSKVVKQSAKRKGGKEFDGKQKMHWQSTCTYVSYLCSEVTLFLFLSTVFVDSWRKLGFNLYNS